MVVTFTVYVLRILRKPNYWSGIWKLKVHLKVKNLVWQICRDYFSTCVKLNSRGINCPLECVTYNDPHEDSYHVFFHCGAAIDTWRAANVWHRIEPSLNQFDNASVFLFIYLLNQVSAAQLLFHGVYGKLEISSFGNM